MSRRRRACVLYLSECTACMSVLCLPPICEQPLRILLRGFIPTTKCAECECARVCSSASGVCVCVRAPVCVDKRKQQQRQRAALQKTLRTKCARPNRTAVATRASTRAKAKPSSACARARLRESRNCFIWQASELALSGAPPRATSQPPATRSQLASAGV